MRENTLFPLAGPVDLAEAIALAQEVLQAEGIGAVGTVLAPFESCTPEQIAQITPLLARCVGTLLSAFRADARSTAAYAALATLPRELAAVMFDLTLEGAFGDGPRDVSVINEIGLLSLLGLLSAAGSHEQAALLLSQARTIGTSPALDHAAWVARCRWAGCVPAMGAHLAPAVLGFADADAAVAGIDAAPLDISAHRARLRFALDAGDIAAAGRAAGAALSLPSSDGDKSDLAPDLALLVAVHAARGTLGALRTDRMRWAFAAAPGVTAAAADALAARTIEGSLPFLDPAEADAAVAYLRSLGAPAAARAVTGYPMRGGKPHVDIVWLEITNHCNQKCTFCPDMFREDARTWLPLPQIKDLIDQLRTR
ncbi:hypothetical protein [Sphingomonas hengshuiensis]|uniref:Radical SAM protein n=1 Tax=Sphingomonas hengshuiensis TaxID=1609977 RepID=A0A7U4LFF0_9SPHN|nr:hypothetical protein [Sphingomonas hengshuiensis]AJP72365.1 hypothetical protein TS85_12080 [Sphingomonas hengshuiensis]